MYPIEYRWISVPMPVTNRAIVIDSGSTKKPASTRSDPDGHPFEQHLGELAVVTVASQQADEHDAGGDERAGRGERRQPAGQGLAEASPDDEEHEEAGQRQGRDQPDEIEHRRR